MGSKTSGKPNSRERKAEQWVVGQAAEVVNPRRAACFISRGDLGADFARESSKAGGLALEEEINSSKSQTEGRREKSAPSKTVVHLYPEAHKEARSRFVFTILSFATIHSGPRVAGIRAALLRLRFVRRELGRWRCPFCPQARKSGGSIRGCRKRNGIYIVDSGGPGECVKTRCRRQIHGHRKRGVRWKSAVRWC